MFTTANNNEVEDEEDEAAVEISTERASSLEEACSRWRLAGEEERVGFLAETESSRCRLLERRGDIIKRGSLGICMTK